MLGRRPASANWKSQASISLASTSDSQDPTKRPELLHERSIRNLKSLRRQIQEVSFVRARIRYALLLLLREGLWRTVKYEEVYLKACQDVKEARAGNRGVLPIL